MKLFSMEVMKSALSEVDLDTGRYESNDELQLARELTTVLFTFKPISGLLTLMHRKKRYSVETSQRNNLEAWVYQVMDACNALAECEFKNNARRYPSSTVRYTHTSVKNIKEALKALNVSVSDNN